MITKITMNKAILYYVYDPMCSWCWGYQPTWTKLQNQLAMFTDKLAIELTVGGLAPDCHAPMPVEMQQFLQQTWHNIHQQLGTEFNHNFWTVCQPRRSTYPSCRAALVARASGLEAQMINAIQQAYYLRAKNPSDIAVLSELAVSIGMDKNHFEQQMHSEEVEQQLMAEITQARQLPIQGFPSLVLQYQQQFYPIKLDYQDADTSLDNIKRLIEG
ncbi:DsbA family protein [Shewanella sp. HL-SH8]|uniref:DsbA family protein n=1 Tax=Shewanella sp. HL-SH8 TaxID=3436242 RepID=UPI003EBBA06A